MGRGVFAGKSAFTQATPRLIVFCAIYALGSIFFGYDGASFGGVQAMEPFLRTFGTWSDENRAYYLPSRIQALMNSLPLLGKFLGALSVGTIIERVGHRNTMAITCCVQIVGPIIQVTSHGPAQFIVGRFLVYLAVGFVENVVPTYQSEIAPGAMRGFLVGTIQLCLTTGSLIAGIVNEAVSTRTNDSGWQIATALQAAPAVLILVMLWFTPNSPRWLVYKDRQEEALKVVRSLRPSDDVANGLPELEVAAMLGESQVGHQQKGAWKDLFAGVNRRRTGIALAIMSFQQLTGVTFSSSYGPTFYRSVGLADNAFIYAVINNAISVITAIAAMILFDVLGRRTLVIHGGWSQGAFLIAVAALGRISSPSTNESNGIVAGMILSNALLHMSLGPGAYVTAAEVSTQALREKTMAISTALNVVVGFVVVFVTPYLLADIGSGLAYIWAGFAFLVVVWAWFLMPELKGRTLEEIDQLFKARLPAWKFSNHETSGLAHELSAFQRHEDDGKAAKVMHLEAGSEENV